jgi:hypothetical protein
LAVQRLAVTARFDPLLLRLRWHHGIVTGFIGKEKRQAVESAQLGIHRATPTELALCPVGAPIYLTIISHTSSAAYWFKPNVNETPGFNRYRQPVAIS